MTEKKELHEIEAEFGQGVAQVVNDYHAQLDRLRAKPDHEIAQSRVPYYVRHDAEQSRALVRAARKSDEESLKAAASQQVEQILAVYPERVAKRREKLEREVLTFPDTDPALLARLSTSTEDELRSMTSSALRGSNEALIRLVYSEARRRDNKPLRQWIAAEVGGSFSELESAPSDEEAQAKVNQQRDLVNSRILK